MTSVYNWTRDERPVSVSRRGIKTKALHQLLHLREPKFIFDVVRVRLATNDLYAGEGFLFGLRNGQTTNVGGRKNNVTQKRIPITPFVSERSERGRDNRRRGANKVRLPFVMPINGTMDEPVIRFKCRA